MLQRPLEYALLLIVDLLLEAYHLISELLDGLEAIAPPLCASEMVSLCVRMCRKFETPFTRARDGNFVPSERTPVKAGYCW